MRKIKKSDNFSSWGSSLNQVVHQRRGRGAEVWLTPPALITALGPFDLDPCFADPRPWDTAAEHYGPDAAGGLGGLFADWHGLVWCNPPYDQDAYDWLARCADHGNAIALVFARTCTEQFHRQVFDRADALFFIEGRLAFHHPSGARSRRDGGAPSVLVCYGPVAVDRVRSAKLRGRLVQLSASCQTDMGDRQ